MARRRRALDISLVRVVIAAATVIAFSILTELLASALHLSRLIVDPVTGVGTVFVYVGYVRLIEQRGVPELAETGAIAELARGFVLGALLFTVTVTALWLIGVCTIAWGDGARALAVPLAGAVGAALREEILMRAILFRIVEQRLGTWIALVLSAALFGLLHAFNPGASVTSTAAIALEAGILLAAAFVLTRRLWMAFGLHAAWNFTEGGVFGASISGHPGHGLFHTHFDGPPILTGGDFGPEASAIAVAICLTAGVVLLRTAYRRGGFVRPSWRR